MNIMPKLLINSSNLEGFRFWVIVNTDTKTVVPYGFDHLSKCIAETETKNAQSNPLGECPFHKEIEAWKERGMRWAENPTRPWIGTNIKLYTE